MWWLKAVALVLGIWAAIFAIGVGLWVLWSHTPWWTPLATMVVVWFVLAVMVAHDELERLG